MVSIMGLLKKNIHLVFFLLVCFLIAVTNYTPGTWLTGWDNLQTELAPSLAIKRALFSVWEEYQSFGLVAGMGHAADLVRSVWIFLLSFVLPQSFIRYFFHASMIFVAGTGMFKLLNFAGFSKEKKNLALLGALFYILNFAVIQLMFLPFEPFSIFFGLLPWEIWIFLEVLEKKAAKKDWILFFVVNLLATSQAYVQQQFVVYILLLLCISIGLLVKERSLPLLKRGAVAFFLILLINSFWLLPQMYFLRTSSVVGQAKINQLATEDVFFANKDKGNLKDFFTFTGFLYDRLDKNYKPLFKDWQNHRETVPIEIIIYGLSAISVLGLIKKSRYQFSFVFIYGLTAVFLLSDTFPFDFINQTMRANSLLNQIFRSPFTKFAIPYALVSGYLFTCGLDLLFSKKHLYSKRLVFVFVAGLIVLQALPAFRGNYFSNEMKVGIPKVYFEVFDYFKNADKNKRIAFLPEYTFWGWFYNSWPVSLQGGGYNGSGFLWYGIEQPIASRTFDVWSNKSESYFWEVKSALEAEDISLLEKVLEKYNVDFLIFDRSLTPIVSDIKALQYDRIDKLLSQSKKITRVKNFDFISIYKISHPKRVSNFTEIAGELPNIGPEIKVTNSDTAYQTYGDYITKSKSAGDIFYPFLDLTTQTKITDQMWNIVESDSSFALERRTDFNADSYKLSTASANEEINLYVNKNAVMFIMPFNITVDKNRIKITFPKIQIPLSRPGKIDLKNCGNKGTVASQFDQKGIEVTATNEAIACFSYEDQYLDQRYGYIVKIKNQNISGQRLFFYILDKTKEQAYLETRLVDNLEYFILGSRFKHGLGYVFSFQENSYKNIPSVNKLTDLSLYLLPYEEIKKLSLTKNQTQIKSASFTDNFEVKKINYFLYAVFPKQGNTIILNQSFDLGWKAYQLANSEWQIANSIKTYFPFIFGQEIKDHVLVNNWANGWKIQSSATSNQQLVVIIFWPQYLEFAGFLFLIGSLIFILRIDGRK